MGWKDINAIVSFFILFQKLKDAVYMLHGVSHFIQIGEMKARFNINFRCLPLFTVIQRFRVSFACSTMARLSKAFCSI